MAISIGSAAAGAAKAAETALSVTMGQLAPFWQQLRIGVLAAKGRGKTHLGLTASKHYVDGHTATQGRVALDDILFIEADQGGLLPAIEQGYDVPTIDVSQLTDAQLFSQWLKIPGLALAWVLEHKTRCVIVDPLSTLTEAYLAAMSRTGDGPPMYNAFAADVSEFFRRMMDLPCPVVFTAHMAPPQMLLGSKSEDKGATLEEVRELREGQAIAQGLENGELPMDLGGKKAIKRVGAALPNIAHLVVRDLPGGKTERILDFKSKTVETKMRLSKVLLPQEPANLNALFNKIAAGLAIPPL